MTCPICDQKPMNCDCTETEKRQWSEIEDLRLTDAERMLLEMLADHPVTHQIMPTVGTTLRGLLERLG